MMTRRLSVISSYVMDFRVSGSMTLSFHDRMLLVQCQEY